MADKRFEQYEQLEERIATRPKDKKKKMKVTGKSVFALKKIKAERAGKR